MIFNNLITDSVKYNRDGGSVTIKIEKAVEKIIITVADTGIGKEDQKKLFNDFVRIGSNETSRIQGNGLGLSTLKRLIELYSGTISLENQKDVSTTFTVNLDGTK